MVDWKAYGEEVARLRNERRLSQERLAAIGNLTQSVVRNVENNQGGHHNDTVTGIQHAFGRLKGQAGYELTAKFLGHDRADAIARDVFDYINRILAALPEDERARVAPLLRDASES